MYCVYVLRSEKNGKFYIGCTDNLDRRLKEHNSGKSKYTRNKGPWSVEYIEKFETLREARQRERQIKSWKKRKSIENLIRLAGPIV